MDKKRNSKNNFVKRQIKMIPQTYRHNKLGTSKLNNFTVNSISIKSNCHLKDSSEMNSKDFQKNFMNKSNANNSKNNINKLRKTYKPASHSNKKIYIKIQQKTDLSEYNIILDRTLDTFDKNKKIKKSLRKKNNTNNNTQKIKITNIGNMKKIRNTTSENRNKIKNKSISDFINVSFGDSSIEINRPKKSENYIFNNFNGRKSNIPHPYRNTLYDKIYNKEENGVNEIKNRILKHKIKNRKLKDIQKEFKENKNKLENAKRIQLYNSINDFMNENENINNEFFRFSKISKYNNNDLDYLNNKNLFSNGFLDNRNSYSINHKVGNHILKFDDKNKSVDDKKEKDNNIMSVPCMNCGKMIDINEIDEHSNNCFEVKEEESTMKKNNYISFVENKLKNIYEYVNNLNNLKSLKLIIEQTLSIKNINSYSINELNKINDNLKYIMEKYYNSTNIFTLLSRVNILLEEKIKYFIKNNIIVNNNKNKIKKLNNSNFPYKNNKAFRNTINCPQINKKLYLNYDNSLDGVISESETMEFFDLKKMERILDKKKKTDNLDNFVNEAKNKRLFLMEVLKVKYQKISENKLENLIPPILIWKEAVKKNIKMKNWSKFIFEELNNPNKYLNSREKIKDKKNENLFNLNDK